MSPTVTIHTGTGSQRRKASSCSLLRIFTRDVNLLSSWVLAGPLECSTCSFHWGTLKANKATCAAFRGKSEGTWVKEAAKWAEEIFVSHWEPRGWFTWCSDCVWFPIGQSHGENEEKRTMQRRNPHGLPAPPVLSVFPEQISSYGTLSCRIIAPVLAANVSHFIMHSPTGHIKVVYKGKAWALKTSF